MLLALAALPVIASVVLGRGAARIGSRLPPGTAVRLLAATAFLAALTTGFGLSVVAFTAVARIPVIAGRGHWSTSILGVEGTPPPVVGAVLGVLVVALLVTALRRFVTTTGALARVALACRRLREVSDGLVLLEEDAADAFAMPGVRGKIVITTGMLRALTAQERRVVLAHEQAHLAQHHQLYVQAAHLAAAANPFLRPVATEVRRLAERWADEHAAAVVDDRRLAARAVAKAALARSASPRTVAPPLALAAAHGDVAQRALALMQPVPRLRPRLVGGVVALGLVSVLGALGAAHTTEVRFERAQAAYDAATPALHGRSSGH